MPASDVFTLSATNGPLLADIEEAMRELGGYYDITLDDLRTIYQHAFMAARQRLFHSLTAETLMTTPALALRQEATVREAATFLDCHSLSGAPIVDEKSRVTDRHALPQKISAPLSARHAASPSTRPCPSCAIPYRTPACPCFWIKKFRLS